MPMFIFPQPGGSPLLSLLVGLAAIAIVIGFFFFFFCLLAGVFSSMDFPRSRCVDWRGHPVGLD